MRLSTLTMAVLTFGMILSSASANIAAQGNQYTTALQLERRGKFKEATRLLINDLDKSPGSFTADEKKKLLFEIERMRRIRIDYSLTAGQLYAQLEVSVKDITRPEFDGWVKKGMFDARTIDDTLRFVNASRSNLFFRYPSIAARRNPPADESGVNREILSACEQIERCVDTATTPYVLPMKFEMEMRLSVDSGAAAPGETIRAWLPIPRKLPYQGGFELLSSSSKPLDVAPPESPIRSAYLEQTADRNGGASFDVRYSYKTFGVKFRMSAGSVKPYDTSDATYRRFTSEGPNIVFTKRIERLSRTIVGGETNPLLKARRIYDWVARNIRYSFAREYSTIRNVSDYCLTKEYGDCGQEAMLFITLCRFNGIPARWQSGWFFFPGGKDIHDWTQIYINPYGWVPVDPYMGIRASRYMNDLSRVQRDSVRDFYFGGLDQYRMTANSDNNQELIPAKKFFRSDNVDFQRGEMETAKQNIYFNQFNYELDIKEISAK